jgi:phosphohistidine phosphatase
MIDLFLIRHGIAAERGTYPTDESRPLTDLGVQKTRQVAQRLHELGLRFDLILSSPLVRAQQTAEILLAAGLSDRLEFAETLSPAGEITDWMTWFQTWMQAGGSALALVGHEPDLGEWAEIFTWGESRDSLVLKKAGIIGLKVPSAAALPGNCQLFWLTAPKLLL